MTARLAGMFARFVLPLMAVPSWPQSAPTGEPDGYRMEDYRAPTGSDDKLLVIYCQRDCWQSWNAAKRALALGYRRVAWYPEGTDGWHDAGLPLENATPAP